MLSKIQWALSFFEGPALDRMGVNHGRPHIAVAQQFLNRSDIVIGLQQMRGKAVAKGVGRDALGQFRLPHSPPDRLLHMGQKPRG